MSATLLGDALTEFVALLVEGGVNAVEDPRDLNLPGVWVTISEIDFDALSGEQYSLAFDCYLITLDTGTGPALNKLGSMLGDLQSAVHQNVSAQPITVTMPNQSADPLPALLVTIPTTIT